MQENIMYLHGSAKVVCDAKPGSCPRSKKHWRSMGIARCDNCRQSSLVINGEKTQPYLRAQYERLTKTKVSNLKQTEGQ